MLVEFDLITFLVFVFGSFTLGIGFGLYAGAKFLEERLRRSWQEW